MGSPYEKSAKRNPESGIKAVFQGPSYKKTLQSYLDEVQELATKVDREANFCSQHSILNIEEYVKSIEKAVRELQRPQTVEMDEVNKQDLTARIGDYLVERVVNRMFGHISSSDGINPRITQGILQTFEVFVGNSKSTKNRRPTSTFTSILCRIPVQ